MEPPALLLVIFNPAAGKGRAAAQLQALREALAASGLPHHLMQTTEVGAARHQAAAAPAKGYRAVIVAGGDGTLNEVVNALVHTTMPVGIIPLGTGNDTAKMFGLAPHKIAAALRFIKHAVPRPVDVGQVNGHHFINGLGIGFDAAIGVRAQRPSWLRGTAVYFKALLLELVHYRSPRLHISLNGEQTNRRRLLVTVGNGRSNGGAFFLTPDAILDDGLFDVCIADDMSRLTVLRFVGRVMRGTHTKLPPVTMARTAALSIHSPDPLPVHVDGEIVGTDLHDLDIKLLPGALLMLHAP